MARVRKHIYRLNFSHLIAVFAKEAEISCLSFNVAGNIYHLFRGECDNALKEVKVTACSGRVHKHNVNLFSFLSHCDHKFTCIGTEKSYVLGFIELGVMDCITYRILVELNTDDLLCLVRCNYTDCTRTAIGVEYGFGTLQVCKIEGGTVKPFCLSGIYLIEGFC